MKSSLLTEKELLGIVDGIIRDAAYNRPAAVAIGMAVGAAVEAEVRERLRAEREAALAEVDRITEAGRAHIRRAAAFEAQRDELLVAMHGIGKALGIPESARSPYSVMCGTLECVNRLAEIDAQAAEIERLKAAQSMSPASAAHGEIALRWRVQADGLYAVDMLVSNLNTESQAHAAMAYLQSVFAGEEIAGRH